MKTRIFAAFLSLLLAVSLLAGCNTQPVPTETQASRQLFQVDITADAPDLASVILDASGGSAGSTADLGRGHRHRTGKGRADAGAGH